MKMWVVSFRHAGWRWVRNNVHRVKRWGWRGRSLQEEVGGAFKRWRIGTTPEKPDGDLKLAGGALEFIDLKKKGRESLVTITSWDLNAARWRHRAYTQGEKSMSSAWNQNHLLVFFLWASPGVSPSGKLVDKFFPQHLSDRHLVFFLTSRSDYLTSSLQSWFYNHASTLHTFFSNQHEPIERIILVC